MTIKQDEAMVCVHVGCEVIWHGPSRVCPSCGWAGVTYREIEALATGVPLCELEPKMATTMIQ